MELTEVMNNPEFKSESFHIVRYGIACSWLQLLSDFSFGGSTMPRGYRRNIKIVNGVQYCQCTKCKEWFPETREYFHWHNKKKGVLQSWCVYCMEIYRKRYNETHVDYFKKYYEDHKEERRDYEIRNQEKHKLYKREYVKKNREKVKMWMAAYSVKNKEKNAIFYQDNKDKFSEYYQDNKDAILQNRKKYAKAHKEEIAQWKKSHADSIASFKTYAHQLTIEESPKVDESGYLQVKCTYCGKYFSPCIKNIQQRVGAIKGVLRGESRLYCSDGCKDACPIFNRKKWPKGFKPATSREVDPLIRQMCLARDKYTCQKCGVLIDEVELHAHHIEGAVQMPMLANDVENTITLCKPCHIWVHQQDGCTNYDLRCK